MLGFGLNSYFNMIVHLIGMMTVVTMVMLPVMYTFSTYHALENYPRYDLNKYALGNIGGSAASCAHA